MKNESVFDKLTKALGDAVADIREKVVEEPWYGRVVNERDGPITAWPQAREPETSLGGFTRNIDVGNPTHRQIGENANYRLEADRDHSADREIDR